MTNDTRNISRDTRYHFRNFLRDIPQNSRVVYRNVYYNIPNRTGHHHYNIEIIRCGTRRLIVENIGNENDRNELQGIAQECVNNMNQADIYISRIENLADVVRLEYYNFVADVTSYYDIMSLLDIVSLVY